MERDSTVWISGACSLLRFASIRNLSNSPTETFLVSGVSFSARFKFWFAGRSNWSWSYQSGNGSGNGKNTHRHITQRGALLGKLSKNVQSINCTTHRDLCWHPRGLTDYSLGHCHSAVSVGDSHAWEKARANKDQQSWMSLEMSNLQLGLSAEGAD